MTNADVQWRVIISYRGDDHLTSFSTPTKPEVSEGSDHLVFEWPDGTIELFRKENIDFLSVKPVAADV